MWTVKVISQGYQKEFVHRIQSIQLRLVKVARQFQVPGYLAGIWEWYLIYGEQALASMPTSIHTAVLHEIALARLFRKTHVRLIDGKTVLQSAG